MSSPVEETADSAKAAALRSDLALDAAGMGEFEWDLTAGQMIISERMARLTGLPAGPMPGGEVADLIARVAPEERASVEAAVRKGLATSGRFDVQFRLVRPDDGRQIWLRGAGVRVRDEAEGKVRLVGIVQDIQEQKALELQRETLVAELDHRVKNVLASVQSLAAQSARKTVSVGSFLKDFAGRLEAMASAHTLLTATRWRGAGIGDIAAAELGGLAPGQARWEGPEIVLNPRATNSLALALHELATNAVKFGALSAEGGRVEVHWGRRPAGGFELVWTERGGPSVSPPERRGFGSTLLERVTGRELGGQARVEFRPDGVRAVLTADASALARTSDEAAAEVATPQAPPDAQPSDQGGASRGLPDSQGVTGLKVLIVEDAMLLAVELEAGLTEAGAIVVGVASNVAEGLVLARGDVDVALLDVNLNGETATPVAALLAERGVPFIFATGYGDAAPAPEGFDAPVVRKPYNVGQIAAALARARGRT